MSPSHQSPAAGTVTVATADDAFVEMLGALVLAHLPGEMRQHAEDLARAAIAAGWIATYEAGRVRLTSPGGGVVCFGIESAASRLAGRQLEADIDGSGESGR